MQSKINLQEIIKFATEAHAGQTRKNSNLPYITHCFQVAKIVYDTTKDENLYAAAICHDILEDCRSVDRNKMKELLGDYIYGIVEELTCDPEQDKQEYLDSFSKKSVEAYIIKIVDRLVNTLDFIVSGDRAYARKYIAKAEKLLHGDWFNISDVEKIYRMMYSGNYCPTDNLIVEIENALDIRIDTFLHD